ncbi:hypothetical protein STEG23_029078 [Scotinomys teguina]
MEPWRKDAYIHLTEKETKLIEFIELTLNYAEDIMCIDFGGSSMELRILRNTSERQGCGQPKMESSAICWTGWIHSYLPPLRQEQAFRDLNQTCHNTLRCRSNVCKMFAYAIAINEIITSKQQRFIKSFIKEPTLLDDASGNTCLSETMLYSFLSQPEAGRPLPLASVKLLAQKMPEDIYGFTVEKMSSAFHFNIVMSCFLICEFKSRVIQFWIKRTWKNIKSTLDMDYLLLSLSPE